MRESDLCAAVVDLLGALVLVTDLHGRIEWLNDVALELVGVGLDALRGRPISDVVPDARPGLLVGHELRCGEGRVHVGLRRLENPRGEVHHVDFWAAPICEQGAVVRVVAVGREVTMELAAQRAHEASEARLGQLIRNLPNVVWMYSLATGEFEYVGPGFERMFGRPPPSGPRTLAQMRDWIHPDDRADAVDTPFTTLVSGLAESVEFEHRVLLPDGALRWVWVRAAPVHRDGRIAEIVGVAADVTARRETESALRVTEERLRRMSESMDEVFFLCSLDRTELYYVNHAFERLWGRPRDDVYANPRLFLDAIHPDDRARCKAAIVSQWYDGFTYDVSSLEFRIVRPDGSIRWIHTRTYPLPEPDGIVRRVLGFNSDITDRKLAELALKERTDQLERSLREKDALLAEVHHRVKNNLQSIAGLVHLMAGQAQRRPLADTITELERRIQAMALVHETLYRSTNLAEVDMQAYLERIGGALSTAVDTRERRIEIAVLARGVALDRESAVRCGFVVNELVTNALKHAFRGRTRGRVEVAMRRDGARCMLRVSDDGSGMPANVDFESEETLGLRLVQGLAGQMGGEARRAADARSAIEVTFLADS